MSGCTSRKVAYESYGEALEDLDRLAAQGTRHPARTIRHVLQVLALRRLAHQLAAIHVGEAHGSGEVKTGARYRGGGVTFLEARPMETGTDADWTGRAA